MTSAHNRSIADEFGAQAAGYDIHAGVQADVARRLAGHLLPLHAPKVLEIGCGTGLFTQHLLEAYPGGDFLITDLAAPMLAAAQARTGDHERVNFAVMDGEHPDTDAGPFDLIAAAMAVQWFADPETGLNRLRMLLKPGGRLVYAVPGPKSFPEWRAACNGEGAEAGLRHLPLLPGQTVEDFIDVGVGSAAAFLKSLKSIGATSAQPGHQPVASGVLRRAMRAFDANEPRGITWHIVYGALEASQSSPSASPA